MEANAMSETSMRTAPAVSRPPAREDRVALELKAFNTLIALRAKVDRENPDPKALESLREQLRAFPLLSKVLCDLHDRNAQGVIASIAKDRVTVEALKATVRHMSDELGYEGAPALERPLIEHVVLCWLRLQKAELAYSQVLAGSPALTQAAYWERRLTMAQGRYLRAGESLARVRRLARPHRQPLQLNIGGQQVNVAGGVTAAAAGAVPTSEGQ